MTSTFCQHPGCVRSPCPSSIGLEGSSRVMNRPIPESAATIMDGLRSWLAMGVREHGRSAGDGAANGLNCGLRRL
jgi:hypothetical protein